MAIGRWQVAAPRVLGGDLGGPVTGVLLSLWRAAAVFRIVAVVFCGYLIVRWRGLYAEPAVAFAVGAAIAVVTLALVVLALAGRAHRPGVVLTDLAICSVLTLASRAAQTATQAHGGMPTLTSVWAAGPAIEAGLLLGSTAGVAAGLWQLGVSLIVRGGYDGRTLVNGLLLVIVGGIAGYLAVLTIRAQDERAQLEAERAQLAERERLSRTIHDGVLQVLALVHRRGLAAGSEWAELGAAAAEQEAALRALITSGAVAPTGLCDVTAGLTALRAANVIVSVPDVAILLPTARAGQLLDAVRAALQNVTMHAGPSATAWIFLENLDREVAVTIRDDGPGMPPGRLDEAVAAGRLGVSGSIRGRVTELGGRVTITSEPGEGTEIELVLPVGTA